MVEKGAMAFSPQAEALVLWGDTEVRPDVGKSSPTGQIPYIDFSKYIKLCILHMSN